MSHITTLGPCTCAQSKFWHRPKNPQIGDVEQLSNCQEVSEAPDDDILNNAQPWFVIRSDAVHNVSVTMYSGVIAY